jgi:hypothetical protein
VRREERKKGKKGKKRRREGGRERGREDGRKAGMERLSEPEIQALWKEATSTSMMLITSQPRSNIHQVKCTSCFSPNSSNSHLLNHRTEVLGEGSTGKEERKERQTGREIKTMGLREGEWLRSPVTPICQVMPQADSSGGSTASRTHRTWILGRKPALRQKRDHKDQGWLTPVVGNMMPFSLGDPGNPSFPPKPWFSPVCCW